MSTKPVDPVVRGRSSIGRASPLQGEGCRFDPDRLHCSYGNRQLATLFRHQQSLMKLRFRGFCEGKGEAEAVAGRNVFRPLLSRLRRVYFPPSPSVNRRQWVALEEGELKSWSSVVRDFWRLCL